jgi:hypothetical protein
VAEASGDRWSLSVSTVVEGGDLQRHLGMLADLLRSMTVPEESVQLNVSVVKIDDEEEWAGGG